MSTTLTGSDVGEPDGSDILWIWARVDLDDPARDDPVRVGLPFRGNVRTQALSHRTCESRIVRCDQMDDTMDAPRGGATSTEQDRPREGASDPTTDLYVHRHLADGYPGLADLADETFAEMHGQVGDDTPRIDRLLLRFQRLTSLPAGAKIAVVGCGPVPQPIKILRDRGYDATGVEPVGSFVERANRYLGDPGIVRLGAAESIPFPDDSQDVVFLESVLEHVDSPEHSLAEVFRVLRPGGFVYLTTTNRHVVSIPDNGEYTVRLFAKLPRLVQEC